MRSSCRRWIMTLQNTCFGSAQHLQTIPCAIQTFRIGVACIIAAFLAVCIILCKGCGSPSQRLKGLPSNLNTAADQLVTPGAMWLQLRPPFAPLLPLLAALYIECKVS